MIWGCLIGLPAYLIAEISQETSLPASLFGEGAVTEDVSGLFYLVNGILCLFVVEAVRRPTVVSVWIPLRRATALGPLLSVPAFFIHEELSTINEWTQLPEWAWVLVASVLVFVISRAARIRDRARGPALRPGLSPRQAAARRCRPSDSARRQPRRNRTPAGGGADALASASLRRRCFARRTASSGGAPAPGGKRRTPIRSQAPGGCSAESSMAALSRSTDWRHRSVRRAVSRRPGATRSRRAGRQSAALLRRRALRRPCGRNRSGRQRARAAGEPRPRCGDRLCVMSTARRLQKRIEVLEGQPRACFSATLKTGSAQSASQPRARTLRRRCSGGDHDEPAAATSRGRSRLRLRRLRHAVRLRLRRGALRRRARGEARGADGAVARQAASVHVAQQPAEPLRRLLAGDRRRARLRPRKPRRSTRRAYASA